MAKKRASRRYHHGDLHAALVQTAVELIQERGAADLSLRECARRLGVSHAAPYRHFADKEKLLFAIARQGFERLEAAGQAAIAELDDPVERLDAYMVAYVRFAFDHPVHHRLMFTHAYAGEGDETYPGAFELLVACAQDVVGRDADPMKVALAGWALPHGLSMLILDRRIPDEHVADGASIEQLTRELIAAWRGPLNRPQRAQRRR